MHDTASYLGHMGSLRSRTAKIWPKPMKSRCMMTISSSIHPYLNPSTSPVGYPTPRSLNSRNSSCAPESGQGVVPTQGEGSDYPPWGGTSRMSFVFRAWGAHLGHLPLNVLGYSRNERRIANSESRARGEGWCSLCGTPAKPMKLKSVEMGAS